VCPAHPGYGKKKTPSRSPARIARFITLKLGANYLIGLTGNRSGILERAQAQRPKIFFLAEADTGWTKEHGRLVL
jgi:hypothetical protein